MTDRHSERAVSLRPDLFRVLGAGWVVSGGLVSAITGPLRLDHGSWVAAFSVLVAGVAQYAFGAAQSALAPQRSSRRTVVAELVAWTLWTYRILLVVIAISIPIGLTLAHLRAG